MAASPSCDDTYRAYGTWLKWCGVDRLYDKGTVLYQFELKLWCTVSRKRNITRLVSEDAGDTVRALAGTDAYAHARRRRQRIEGMFGHLKRNLRLRKLKLRGLAGAAEEFTIAAAAYNLQLLARQVAPV